MNIVYYVILHNVDQYNFYSNANIFSSNPSYLRSTSQEVIDRALKIAFDKGYYDYPHKLTIADLSKVAKKSYSTLQEHLRKAERKLVGFFLRYK